MLEIRPYRPEDEDAALGIFKSLQSDFFAEQETSTFRRWLHKSYDAEYMKFYILEIDGKIQGCGGFVIDPQRQQAVLAWGMVHKEYQNSGLGTALLDYRIAKIKEHMPEGKILTMDTTQLTAPFFERIGFQTTRIRKDYHREGLDRYEMELVIA
ncbi:MAG: GNAT family N-acetyltransferase [Bacteroidia bacterium]